MVPPNWDHPHDEHYPDRLKSMYDRNYEAAKAEWLQGLAEWNAGTHPSYRADCDYWEWVGNPPARDMHRPWKDEDATWFQVWETVSEGTPVTPPFATREELVQYLVEKGDFWDQKRFKEDQWRFRNIYRRDSPGWPRENAIAFVGAGWAPSMVMVNGKCMGPSEMADAEL